MPRYTLSPDRDDPLQALSKLERKRAQNRIAQRNYSMYPILVNYNHRMQCTHLFCFLGQNQKQRMLALEVAAAHSLDAGLIRPPTQTPPKSDSTESNPTPYMSATNQLDLSPEHHEPLSRDTDYLFGTDQFAASPPSLRHGQPALHIALKTGNSDMVRLLLKSGADMARQDSSEGNSALHVAASSGREDIVRLLLDQPNAPLGNLEMANFLGQTPLFMAVQSDNEAVTAQLLDAGADISVKDSMGNSVLHLAVERESIPIAALLLARGAHVDD